MALALVGRTNLIYNGTEVPVPLCECLNSDIQAGTQAARISVELDDGAVEASKYADFDQNCLIDVFNWDFSYNGYAAAVVDKKIGAAEVVTNSFSYCVGYVNTGSSVTSRGTHGHGASVGGISIVSSQAAASGTSEYTPINCCGFIKVTDVGVVVPAVFLIWRYTNGISTSITAYVPKLGEYLFPQYFPNEEINPYNPLPPATIGGGGGNFGNGVTSDPIDIPSGGAFGSTGAVGSFTRYLCSPNLLKTLFDRIWTNDWGMNLVNDVLNGIFGDPAQSIISIVQFPFQIANQGTLTGLSTVAENFYWGRWNSGISTSRLSSETIKIDWGELTYSNQPNSPTGRWFGNFMDYAPYTKVDLYLPWCTGFVNLDVNEFYPGSIKIETYVDLVSGSCVHNVWGKQVDETFYHVIGCYSGQCGRSLAWNSDDWASKVGKVTMAAAGLAAGAIVGGAAALAGTAVASTGAAAAARGATITTGLEAMAAQYPSAGLTSGALYNKSMGIVMRGQEQIATGNAIKQTGAEIFKSKAGDALQGINAATNQPVNVSRSGSFTDGNAGIQPQYPYLVFSRPKLNMPANYAHYFGLPSNIYANIGTLSGYTEISECHWENLGCTFEEQAEIDRLMKAGVIL